MSFLSQIRFLFLFQIMVDAVVEEADDETEEAADEEADGIFQRAVVPDIEHN